jgi:hypothetical protein
VISELYKIPTSLKNTLKLHRNKPTPKVKAVKMMISGIAKSVSRPISAPSTTIKMEKGIKDSARFINEVNTSEMGRVMFWILIDLMIPRLAIMESMAVLVE